MRISAGRGRGPFSTAAMACSSWSSVAMPISAVPIEGVEITKRVASSARLAAMPSSIIGRKRRARARSPSKLFADPIGSGGGLAFGSRAALPDSAPPASVRMPITPMPLALVCSNIRP
jgi:hypothetical protein